MFCTLFSRLCGSFSCVIWSLPTSINYRLLSVSRDSFSGDLSTMITQPLLTKLHTRLKHAIIIVPNHRNSSISTRCRPGNDCSSQIVHYISELVGTQYTTTFWHYKAENQFITSLITIKCRTCRFIAIKELKAWPVPPEVNADAIKKEEKAVVNFVTNQVYNSSRSFGYKAL